ncbi:unnamed protein product [Chilo suppressalis]|uniref:Uncharacterized protein n=1 Tax=Chilo suppressalis TaxID=168631 RepID=A0ABN8AZJ7_CHISP|nr:unnamed protein product [Chilo suppressalis]
MTPLSKTESFIEQNMPTITTPEKQTVKKQLLNYNVLTTALQKMQKIIKNAMFKGVVENDIVKKYKAKSITTTVLGLKGRARRRKILMRKSKILIDGIKHFYERDDVSRATAGKNEVKTLKKNKQQRRYLLNSLKALYKKYRLAETDIAKYSIPDTLTPVPHTMALHQIANTEAANVIKYRCLSCFCDDMLSFKGYCECLDVKTHLLVQNKDVEKENENKNNPDQKNKAKRVIKRTKKMTDLSEMSDSEEEQKEYRNKKKKICKDVERKNETENNPDRKYKVKRVIERKRKVTKSSEMTDSEEEQKEKRNEEKKICKNGGNKNEKKITILSDVKGRPENRAFCVTTIGSGPLNLKRIEKPDILNIENKVNINTDYQTPSTSGICRRPNIAQKTISRNRNKPIIDSNASSTENEDEFSLHHTSDDEPLLPDTFLKEEEKINTNAEKHVIVDCIVSNEEWKPLDDSVIVLSGDCGSVYTEEKNNENKKSSGDGASETVEDKTENHEIVQLEKTEIVDNKTENHDIVQLEKTEIVDNKTENHDIVELEKTEIITNTVKDCELPNTTKEKRFNEFSSIVTTDRCQ